MSAAPTGCTWAEVKPRPVHVWQSFQSIEPAPLSSNASSARKDDDDSPILTELVQLSNITHELTAPRPGEEPRLTEPSVASAGAGDGFKRTNKPSRKA